MKLHMISDTHTKHRELDLPGGEVLIHSGDFMSSGYAVRELEEFLQWMNSQDYTYKILVAGNHDKIFEVEPALAKDIVSNYTDINYLQDNSCIINGIKFYGSPYTPAFCDWSFQLHNDNEAEEKWSQIPEDTDVLITHGPAYGRLDQYVMPTGGLSDRLGCPHLAKRIEKINPKLHICGHIHTGNGVLDGYGETTTHINAACLGEDYNFIPNDKGYIEWVL